MRATFLIAGALVVVGCSARPTAIPPQPAVPFPLRTEITRMDDSLSAAFNAHDLDGLMRLFTSDLEFYHDTQGLQRRDAVRAGFGNLFTKRIARVVSYGH